MVIAIGIQIGGLYIQGYAWIKGDINPELTLHDPKL